ncbi:MAG: sortase [Clostridia bacterium]|nr:sortase [Clostridia bacterium]
MSTIYPPYEQYRMDHPDEGFSQPPHMAYPPFDEFAFYTSPQSDPFFDPFAPEAPFQPNMNSGYAAQPYNDPFASPQAHQQTQLYHFGAYTAAVPPYHNTMPQAPPAYMPRQMPYQAPMYPQPQAAYIPAPAPVPPVSMYGQMYPPLRQQGMYSPSHQNTPAPQQRQPSMQRPPQGGQQSGLRPRTQGQTQGRTMQPPAQGQMPKRPQGSAAATNQTPKPRSRINAAYPPPSNHVPIDDPEQHTPHRNNTRGKERGGYRKGSMVAIVFFSILCIVSLTMLGYLLIPRLLAKSEYISLTPSQMTSGDDGFSMSNIQALVSSKPMEEDSTAQNLTSELLAYYDQVNPDFIGWLDIPGTQVHYPLVRTGNNEYYLTHTFKGSYSDYGSIYADYRCTDNFSDANTVFYGHNMRNGTMFHDLVNMLDEDYLKDRSTFTITTADAQVLTYQIFSVHETHVATDYRTISLYGSARVTYFETLASYSDVDTQKVEFTEDSRIITFSTCPNDSDDMYRVAVHAVLIDTQPLEQ